jgi:DNA-directed RNA polymerase alpha subunit
MDSMSIRLRNCLINEGITLEEAKSWSDLDLLRIRNFGRKCLQELRTLEPRSTRARVMPGGYR